MRKLSSVLLATVVAFAGVGNAFADAEAGQGYFSVLGSYIDDDRDRGVEDGFVGGELSLGYAMNEAWNIEGVVTAAIPDGSPGATHLGVGVELMRVFRRAEPFSPYLHGGAGYFSSDPNGTGGEDDGGALSLGLGFLLDLGESNVALQVEYKHRFDTATPSTSNFHDDILSVGLHIPFGEGTPKFIDSDGDGVADGIDRCPNTAPGASVDAYGCELDSDGDGVRDSIDKCPGTPRGVRVNADGCAGDSDGDGVTDDKDKCPNTARGAAVDADGCELDSDNDGVVDRLDECPGTPAGAQVDIKGCEIKEEITLQGVNFESNSDRLLPGATSVLDDAAATLRKNPTITVEVAGHTDSDGAAEYNESLSARRATTVHDYLVSNGIADERMSVRGYGESQPIADNTSAAGKAANRRVVLRIIER